MYKLKLKFSPLLIVALLVFVGAALVLPTLPMLAGGYSIHWSVVVLSVIGVLFILSLLLFDKASKSQKYKVFLTMVTWTALYGIIGNFMYNFWKFQTGGMLEFSWAQIGIMVAGGILTTFAMYKLEPFDQFAAGGLERLQKSKAHDHDDVVQPAVSDPKWESASSAEDLMPKPKAGAASSSSNKLRGMSVSKTDMQASTPAPQPVEKPATPLESAQALMTPSVEIDLDAADEMLSGPLNASPAPSVNRPAAGAGAAAKSGGTPPAAESKSGATTGNRLQAQRRRNTSTFTKLQALSASGTGTVRPSGPGQDTGGGGGDLRSLLDRLDAEPTSEQAEEIPAPEEIRVEILFTEFEAQKKAAEPARPAAAAAAPAKPAPVRELPQPANKPAAATTGGAAKMDNKPAPGGADAGGPRLASLLDRAEALAGDEEEKEEAVPAARETIREPEPVKQEPPAREAAKPAPAAASAEPEAGGLLAKRFMELSDDDEEEEAPPAVSTSEEPVEEPEEGELVFAEGVDNDIDDIFTGLAPADAQREVAHREDVEEEAPQARAEEEADSGVYEEVSVTDGEDDRENIFSESVDGDIDDIFSNLAPADAQRTVEDYKEEQEDEEEAAEPAEESNLDQTGELQMLDRDEITEEESASSGGEDEENEEGPLFQLGDSDVDDIFSGITEGDQSEVNAETLKKLRAKEQEQIEIPSSGVETGDNIPVVKQSDIKSAKQTGDMPAMSKEQAAKISAEAAKARSQDEEEEEEESEEAEAVPESPEAAKLKKELKEFGKLSNKSAATPKPGGEAVGTMKTIGKLLIDTQAVENIIKAGEQRKLGGGGLTTARVISSARGQGITELLNKIDLYEGVVGSLIVGHDGLVMASTLKQGWDKDMMGALSTALLSTSNLTTKKLEIGKLRQMVMLTKLNGVEKTTVLTDVDVGILAVFVEETEVEKIDGLLDTIHKTIHG